MTTPDKDRKMLQWALHYAAKSLDPSTKVGCVITNADDEIITGGFNSFPKGVAYTDDRLTNRDQKLQLMVHGEMNAVLQAAKHGFSLKGSTLYMAAMDAKTGDIWGGCPCTRCTVEILQTGISRIVSYPTVGSHSKWHMDTIFASNLLLEAGIPLVHYPVE